MSLLDLHLASCYETTESRAHLLNEFYIPVLERANKYYRIAGYFSSSALAIAAKGIEGLIQNGGKMYLLISPELSEDDYRIIREHGTITEEASIFSNLDLDHAINENLQALAWLLDCGRLEIKIAVTKRGRTSLFHQKVGIVFDEENNVLSFSGSINETAQAWLDNVEEFKVFRSWESGQEEYVNADLTKFLEYWKNERRGIAEVYTIPESVRDKIVQIRPKDIWDLNMMRKYRRDQAIEENELSLFPHQAAAVQMWLSNNCSLLMEMATGTGKTRTAIACILEKLKVAENPMLIIVSTPQNTLSRQWKREMEDLNVSVERASILDGSSPNWRKSLECTLLDLHDKIIRSAVIFTTHETASSSDFAHIIQHAKYDTTLFFVCDEVHAIGSNKHRNALLDIYEYRIGLSATPERMFDDVGTYAIRTFFGNKSFEFTIADALSTINPLTGKPFLNPFCYYPIFVSLTAEEIQRYRKISQKIAIIKSQEDYDPDELQRLYTRRANIGKNAERKPATFEMILDRLGPETVTDTILFVSDKQIQLCFDIMQRKRVKHAKITESESASKIVNQDGETERQEIIAQFSRQQLQVLVGMKCLDEGIDIKTARIAILMASSTNPREFVQRVGRVIRPAPGKGMSEIYDLIVLPPALDNAGLGLLQKEARRAFHIAKNATNYQSHVVPTFQKIGVNLDAN